MKETLKRELNKTYLILSSEETLYEESYELEMILENAPEALLPLHVLRVNGQVQLFYDLSSKQSLGDGGEREKLSLDTLRSLFEQIDGMLKEMKDYLLDGECVVLDLKHIYAKGGRFYFCYCPWERQELVKSLRNLLEEILERLDYRNAGGVALAYHLYQNACKGSLCIEEVLEEHCRKEEPEEVSEEPCEDRLLAEEPGAYGKSGKRTEIRGGESREKKGIFWKVLQFFIKKEGTEPEDDFFRREKEGREFFRENSEEKFAEKRQVPCNTDTMLLDQMPGGRWRLHPMFPGYEEFEIDGTGFTVGKKQDSVDGYIGRDTISRIHSRLSVRQGHLFISDANSTNGTFVNGVAIQPGEDVEIFPGDRILFADVGYECYNSL